MGKPSCHGRINTEQEDAPLQDGQTSVELQFAVARAFRPKVGTESARPVFWVCPGASKAFEGLKAFEGIRF